MDYLQRSGRWGRDLLKLVRACDEQRVGPETVADQLAALNYRMHGIYPSVGPRSIVVWRHRKGVRNGGGGQRCFNGLAPDKDCPILPTLGGGGDVGALLRVIQAEMMRSMNAGIGPGGMDWETLNARLAEIPDKPDETLT